MLRGRALARVWWQTVTVAEFLGFLAPACAGAMMVDASAAVGLPVLLVAGAAEGAVLGAGQAHVLRRALPGLPVGRWVSATASAAVFAYALGMVPAAVLSAPARPPMELLVVGAVVLGAGLLGSLGGAQWLVLRHLVPRAGRWVGVTALAWALGLGAFALVTTPLWQPGQAGVTVVAIGALGGLVMAAVTAAVTGQALRRLLP